MDEICYFCLTFQKSRKRHAIKIGDTLFYKRHCKSAGRYKDPSDSGCDKFTHTTYFYCHTSSFWTTMKTCISRQKKQLSDECGKCSEGRQVINIMRGRRDGEPGKNDTSQSDGEQSGGGTPT